MRRTRAGEDVLNSTLGTLMDEEGRLALLPSVCEAFRRIGPERTAAAMRKRGVYVVPIPGAVRVALCSTPLAAVPRLVEALVAGVRAAGGQETPAGS